MTTWCKIKNVFAAMFLVSLLMVLSCKERMPSSWVADRSNVSEDSVVHKIMLLLADEKSDSAKPEIAYLIRKRGKMDGQLYMMRGRVFILDLRFEDARKDFQNALFENYKKDEAYDKIAFTYVCERNYGKGILYLDSCLIINPQDSNVIRRKIKLQKLKGLEYK